MPTLGVSATSLSFGNESVNSAATQTLTLSSTGTAAVTISAETISGAGFTVSGATFPLTLNPNQTATLTVQFDPTAAGAATGALTLTSNSSTGTTTTVSLSGTGVPVLTGLTCTNGSFTGAGTDSCTVTLNAAAATGGFAVSLASNNSTCDGAGFGNCCSGSDECKLYGHGYGGEHGADRDPDRQRRQRVEDLRAATGRGVPTLSVSASSLVVRQRES